MGTGTQRYPRMGRWGAARGDAACALLRQLGLTENYIGFSQTACAIHLVLEEPGRLRLITKLLYPAIALECGTTQTAVERNLRTACTRIWSCNRAALERVAGIPLAQRPSNVRFLAILTGALRGRGMETVERWGKMESSF